MVPQAATSSVACKRIEHVQPQRGRGQRECEAGDADREGAKERAEPDETENLGA